MDFGTDNTQQTGYIGRQINAAGEYWNGWISEVVLYSSALTQRNRKIIEWSEGNFYNITVGSQ